MGDLFEGIMQGLAEAAESLQLPEVKAKIEEIIRPRLVNGRDCTVEKIDFSFAFSVSGGKLSVRGDPVWPSGEAIEPDAVFTYDGARPKRRLAAERARRLLGPSEHEMRPGAFLKKYLPLFLLAWEDQLAPDDLRAYFLGKRSFSELLSGLREPD